MNKIKLSSILLAGAFYGCGSVSNGSVNLHEYISTDMKKLCSWQFDNFEKISNIPGEFLPGDNEHPDQFVFAKNKTALLLIKLSLSKYELQKIGYIDSVDRNHRKNVSGWISNGKVLCENGSYEHVIFVENLGFPADN